MTIGQKIRELREKTGMLQRELAYELKVGDAYLSKIENNNIIISNKVVIILFDNFVIIG